MHIFVPAEKMIPKIRIETRQANKLRGERIIVAADHWPRHSRYPIGHFVRSLGRYHYAYELHAAKLNPHFSIPPRRTKK